MRRLAAGLALFALFSPVFPQALVVEAGAGESQPRNPPLSSSANSGNDVIVNMYLQLEALQQEVQNLRGQLEEQSYQIRRMQAEQRDRYLDLDSRVGRLSADLREGTPLPQAAGEPAGGAAEPLGGAGAMPPLAPPASSLALPAEPVNPNSGLAGNGVAADRPSEFDAPARGTGMAIRGLDMIAEPGGETSARIGGAGETRGTEGMESSPGGLAVNPQNEQDLYRAALDLLLERSEYQQAIELFQRYISGFPQGRYLANALYWQGEALLLVEQYNQAQAVFSRVLAEFPEDPKAPGAMLKLGVAYERMGNDLLAAQTWSSISIRYPDSATEIRYAQDYLRQAAN